MTSETVVVELSRDVASTVEFWLGDRRALICPECRCGHIFPADLEAAHATCSHDEGDRKVSMQLVEVMPVSEHEATVERLAAEGDANRADALANLDALETHRRARSRAEAALEEAAAEFERRAEDREGRIGREDITGGDAYLECAQLLREKQAALKEVAPDA